VRRAQPRRPVKTKTEVSPTHQKPGRAGQKPGFLAGRGPGLAALVNAAAPSRKVPLDRLDQALV
jgi:hypothetical protein